MKIFCSNRNNLERMLSSALCAMLRYEIASYVNFSFQHLQLVEAVSHSCLILGVVRVVMFGIGMLNKRRETLSSRSSHAVMLFCRSASSVNIVEVVINVLMDLIIIVG